jgi:hypothetical protein
MMLVETIEAPLTRVFVDECEPLTLDIEAEQFSDLIVILDKQNGSAQHITLLCVDVGSVEDRCKRTVKT